MFEIHQCGSEVIVIEDGGTLLSDVQLKSFVSGLRPPPPSCTHTTTIYNAYDLRDGCGGVDLAARQPTRDNQYIELMAYSVKSDK